MSKKNGNGGISRYRGWWTVRYRETVCIGGEVRTIQRRKRLAPISPEYKTAASVEGLADEYRPDKENRHFTAIAITTVADFCESVYLPYVGKHKRPSTVRGYQQVWNYYFKPLCKSVQLPPREALLKDVRTYHVQQWLETIADHHGISRTTLQHVKHFLSGMFKHAAQQGYRDSALGNPVTLASIPPNAPAGEEGEAYSFDEVNRMLEVLLEPAAAAVATAAWGGFREGELRGLQWEDYKLATNDALGMLCVTRSVWRNHVGKPKTKKSAAPVLVIPQLADRLAVWRELCGNPASGPIFPNRLGRPLNLDWLYQNKIKDVLAKSGIRWKGWHGFRRGLASNLNQLGVDDSVIQAILRHSNVATTQKHYIKTTTPQAEAAMRRLSISIPSGRS
jgi:integrase